MNFGNKASSSVGQPLCPVKPGSVLCQFLERASSESRRCGSRMSSISSDGNSGRNSAGPTHAMQRNLTKNSLSPQTQAFQKSLRTYQQSPGSSASTTPTKGRSPRPVSNASAEARRIHSKSKIYSYSNNHERKLTMQSPRNSTSVVNKPIVSKPPISPRNRQQQSNYSPRFGNNRNSNASFGNHTSSTDQTFWDDPKNMYDNYDENVNRQDFNHPGRENGIRLIRRQTIVKTTTTTNSGNSNDHCKITETQPRPPEVIHLKQKPKDIQSESCPEAKIDPEMSPVPKVIVCGYYKDHEDNFIESDDRSATKVFVCGYKDKQDVERGQCENCKYLEKLLGESRKNENYLEGQVKNLKIEIKNLTMIISKLEDQVLSQKQQFTFPVLPVIPEVTETLSGSVQTDFPHEYSFAPELLMEKLKYPLENFISVQFPYINDTGDAKDSSSVIQQRIQYMHVALAARDGLLSELRTKLKKGHKILLRRFDSLKKSHGTSEEGEETLIINPEIDFTLNSYRKFTRFMYHYIDLSLIDLKEFDRINVTETEQRDLKKSHYFRKGSMDVDGLSRTGIFIPIPPSFDSDYESQEIPDTNEIDTFLPEDDNVSSVKDKLMTQVSDLTQPEEQTGICISTHELFLDESIVTKSLESHKVLVSKSDLLSPHPTSTPVLEVIQTPPSEIKILNCQANFSHQHIPEKTTFTSSPKIERYDSEHTILTEFLKNDGTFFGEVESVMETDLDNISSMMSPINEDYFTANQALEATKAWVDTHMSYHEELNFAPLDQVEIFENHTNEDLKVHHSISETKIPSKQYIQISVESPIIEKQTIEMKPKVKEDCDELHKLKNINSGGLSAAKQWLERNHSPIKTEIDFTELSKLFTSPKTTLDNQKGHPRVTGKKSNKSSVSSSLLEFEMLESQCQSSIEQAPSNPKHKPEECPYYFTETENDEVVKIGKSSVEQLESTSVSSFLKEDSTNYSGFFRFEKQVESKTATVYISEMTLADINVDANIDEIDDCNNSPMEKPNIDTLVDYNGNVVSLFRKKFNIAESPSTSSTILGGICTTTKRSKSKSSTDTNVKKMNPSENKIVTVFDKVFTSGMNKKQSNASSFMDHDSTLPIKIGSPSSQFLGKPKEADSSIKIPIKEKTDGESVPVKKVTFSEHLEERQEPKYSTSVSSRKPCCEQMQIQKSARKLSSEKKVTKLQEKALVPRRQEQTKGHTFPKPRAASSSPRRSSHLSTSSTSSKVVDLKPTSVPEMITISSRDSQLQKSVPKIIKPKIVPKSKLSGSVQSTRVDELKIPQIIIPEESKSESMKSKVGTEPTPDKSVLSRVLKIFKTKKSNVGHASTPKPNLTEPVNTIQPVTSSLSAKTAPRRSQTMDNRRSEPSKIHLTKQSLAEVTSGIPPNEIQEQATFTLHSNNASAKVLKLESHEIQPNSSLIITPVVARKPSSENNVLVTQPADIGNTVFNRFGWKLSTQGSKDPRQTTNVENSPILSLISNLPKERK